MSQRPHAILALADGTVFYGVSIGVDGINTGEVAFNTAMTGYQEILTDPSYCQQIITLTYPHIGNTGINPEDFESGNLDKVYATGLVIRDLPLVSSNRRQTQTEDAERSLVHTVDSFQGNEADVIVVSLGSVQK